MYLPARSRSHALARSFSRVSTAPNSALTPVTSTVGDRPSRWVNLMVAKESLSTARGPEGSSR